MAFPTIAAPVKVSKQAIDNAIKSPTEAGYVQTRPRFTRDIYNFEVQYKLSLADRDLLLTHDASVKTSTIFAWTNPEDNTSYNVRQTERVKYDRTPDEKGYFNVSHKLQSV